jgi:hypothetical protein
MLAATKLTHHPIVRMQAMQEVNNYHPSDSDGSYAREVFDDDSISSSVHKTVDTVTKDLMITGRINSDHSVDSPTLSRTSSDSEEIIDHTAALLGFMEDSDEDDLREISGFSPAVSLDLELEPIGDEEERNATFEKIFSGDELDDEPTQRASRVMPMQLNFASAAAKKTTVPKGEFYENDTPVKKSDQTAKPADGKARKSIVNDVPFFYFDSRLVAQAVEEYGQRKRTDIDNKRKQAALKAKALKDKASSAIHLKAKKAIAVPHAMWDKKVQKSHDEIDQRMDDREDKADGAKRASKAALMKIRAKAAFNEKAKKAKQKMSLPKAVKDRKQKSSQEEVSGTQSTNIDEIRMYSGMKLPTLPTPPPVREYITKTGITVIGDMNKLVKQASGSIPAISSCASNVSSNNSQIIDEDGFIISPTSSIDLISPVTSFDGIDGASSVASPKSIASPKITGGTRGHLSPCNIASPRSIASPKANRGELPPLGKKTMPGQIKKDSSNKMALKIGAVKPRSHRRTTTASF